MSGKKYPSELQDRFIVRFPDDGMRTRIAREAATNGRSMNAEIISRLQQSFEDGNTTAKVSESSALERVQDSIDALRAQLDVMQGESIRLVTQALKGHEFAFDDQQKLVAGPAFGTGPATRPAAAPSKAMKKTPQ